MYVGAGRKPGSVPRNGHPLWGNDYSSSFDVATEIERPTRELERTTLDVPLFGLAPGGVYLAPAVTGRTGELLPHLFTLTRRCGGAAPPGGLFSVALSFPSPGLGVTQRPVLRSPDFPPLCVEQSSNHLSCSDIHRKIRNLLYALVPSSTFLTGFRRAILLCVQGALIVGVICPVNDPLAVGA